VKSGTEPGFLWLLPFSLPVLIPPVIIIIIVRGWYKGPIAADIPSELGLTPSKVEKDGRTKQVSSENIHTHIIES
jgi:hypothetical protein